MSKFQHLVRTAMVAAAALLLATSLAAAAEGDAPSTKTSAATTGKATKSAKSSTAAQKQSAALAALPEADQKPHHLILQVNSNDAAAMNLALNNASNVSEYYKQAGEKVEIEVVAFGPGLHMLRDDTSPVKARIETMALSMPEVSFKGCGITQANMRKAENKEITLIPQAQLVPSGVVRVIQLQEQGWSYVKP